MSDDYFTEDKIEELTTKHNWEIVAGERRGTYKLRQKDKHYMTTVDFEITEEATHKFDLSKVREYRGERLPSPTTLLTTLPPRNTTENMHG